MKSAKNAQNTLFQRNESNQVYGKVCGLLLVYYTPKTETETKRNEYCFKVIDVRNKIFSHKKEKNHRFRRFRRFLLIIASKIQEIYHRDYQQKKSLNKSC